MVSITVLVALLVCLAPTTIGALLSAIGIAGMNRLSQANVVAMSGRAVEAAGDVDVLLLDKTGTITLGNRQAAEFVPAPGVDVAELADAAQLASLADETPEGRSIVVLAKKQYGLRGRELGELGATFVPFTAQTRMSGVDLDGRRDPQGRGRRGRGLRQRSTAARCRRRSRPRCEDVAKQGGTPLVVADGAQGAGSHPPQGHRQGRHPRALPRPQAHGDQDGDDHRRQPGDRRLDRRRGRRGRLPGRGDSRGEARPDPRVPDRAGTWWP